MKKRVLEMMNNLLVTDKRMKSARTSVSNQEEKIIQRALLSKCVVQKKNIELLLKVISGIGFVTEISTKYVLFMANETIEESFILENTNGNEKQISIEDWLNQYFDEVEAN